jgi:quercetin dioxygenase-like cupin family protein
MSSWEEGNMVKRLVLCTAFLTCGLVLWLNAQQPPSPVQPAPIKRTILQRADVPGTNLEIIYATVEITAGFKAGRHHHPGVVMGQVVEGDFWLHVDGRPEQILHAGESVTLPDRAVHNEGAMDKPVKLNAVYVVEKGQPLASPAP